MIAGLQPAALRGRTKLLVLQGTPFCNIDCDYCYLAERSVKARMPMAMVGESVRWIFENGLGQDDTTVVWHAGEPLTLPRAWYEKAFAVAAEVAPSSWNRRHAFQTNGTLIDDAWCAFFAGHKVRVGVSLDGPAALHDLHRKRRDGHGSHAAAMRGVAALKRNEVPFHVICVVTEASLSRSDALIEFFAGEGIVDVGFNIEEIEGVHTGSTLAVNDGRARFRAFFERAVERADELGISIREVRGVLGAAVELPNKDWPGNDQNMPFVLVTVTRDGAIYTFSPELAGIEHPEFGTLALGHVGSDSLADIIDGQVFQTQWAEISAGIAACARDCAYFPLCRGGAPSNKLGELGTFAGTETMACRLGQQEVAEVVLGRILKEMERSSVLAEAS
ncbi:GRRM system radical SAM/SPASM domain protein [Nordella sp. HKS 07]|uniref:cyclophane-forming radical SAM/SPASM peptide maturase GrrM/OscB n=1 Tax=Nordella sp. HKS 07 TaxID=2712222 RepID=UPI0013E1DFB4|nr:cyclophane-forming radical SAM/SPASM peptide maturase GrrM/OscB [Nordella sp. HKS 07]QIG50609.1 GRRM system radical SAM/SPASM domain protein [Nordella sp. HKS 07]